MDTIKLGYFLEIARLKSISKATKILNISQSQLSRDLIKFEKEINAKLFNRTLTGLVLTPAGELLFKKGEYILNKLKNVEAECKDLESGLKGKVTIGAVTNALGTIIPEALKSFREKYKDVSFRIEDLDSHSIVEGVKLGIFDFGIVKTPFNEDGLEIFKLPKTSYVLIGEDNEIFKKENISLDEVRKLPLILNSSTREVFSKYIESFEENIVCECNDSRTVISLVQRGIGFGIVHEDTFKTFSCHTLCHKRLQVDEEIETAIIYTMEKYKTQATKNFIKEIEDFLPLKIRGKIFF